MKKMSILIDVVVTFFHYFIPTVFAALILLLTALKFSSTLRKVIFQTIFCRVIPQFWASMKKYKLDMFADLSTMKPSSERAISILEVGPGPGANFPYYPDGARLILLEPNEYFLEPLKENYSKYPKLIIDRVISGVGEHMSSIKDNSIDVVVATHVLCSVDDVNEVLREIHRVLIPGGRYYFVEHGHHQRSMVEWMVQRVSNPFWKLFINGCQINKDTIRDIETSGLFVDMNSKTFMPSKEIHWVFRVFLGLNYYGSAVKKGVCTNNSNKEIVN